MEGKVLYVVLALVASSTAASISGMASLDLNQASAGGQVTFPRIPGINSPLFSFQRPSQNNSGNTGIGSILSHIPVIGHFLPGNNNNNNNSSSSNNNSNSTKIPGIPNFDDFISAIPGLNNFIPGSSGFPSGLESLLSNIPALNGNGTKGSNFTLPAFPQLPDVDDGPYIPGVSEALREARQHLQAMFNITGDIGTGMHDAIHAALSSDNPLDSIGVMIRTIGKVYATVAANCPLIIVGQRVFNEGVRLAFEVIRSVGNVAVGPQNNLINNIAASVNGSVTGYI